MKTLIYIVLIINISLCQSGLFKYELDLTIENDAFNVTLYTPPLTKTDNIYSFVSYAPGVHQPLDFGRFVKLFKVYDKSGKELLTQKLSINDFKIIHPERVHKIYYEIDDSFDMSTDYHPIYPMSGTGITENYTIINTHGVFGYFNTLKNNPILLKLKVNGDPKIGTALNKNKDGNYAIDSYYHLTDSPILIGDILTYASKSIGGIEVEVYAYSPIPEINAKDILDAADPILNSAKSYVGFAPVKRYTMLMYFASKDDVKAMPVFKAGGALEHSLSSTYALSADVRYLPFLNNIIAHEYMHILSPLNLHSNVLANFDYSDPVSEDKHVWLYEGVTEWVSFNMQVRSGVKSIEDYLKFLSEKSMGSDQYSSEYSLTRISRDWSTDEGNKQYGNIYQLGALTAAMLDIKLLELSNGERGLREVYLELIQKYGPNNPFNNDTFFDVLVEMTYPEIKLFIENHIQKNTPFDFSEVMKTVGITYSAQKKKSDVPTMGLHIYPDANDRAHIRALSKNYKGEQLKVEDMITKVLGQPLNRATFKDMDDKIKSMSVGDTYEIEINRQGTTMKLTEKLYTDYAYHVFEIDENATSEQKKLRQIWLSKF